MKSIHTITMAAALTLFGGCSAVPMQSAALTTAAQSTAVEPATVMQVETSEVMSPSGAGGVIGALIGGVLGHQVGKGNGNTVATVLGALTGGAIGANAAATAHPVTTVMVKTEAGRFVQLSSSAYGPGAVYVGQPVYLVTQPNGAMSLVARK